MRTTITLLEAAISSALLLGVCASIVQGVVLIGDLAL